MMLSRRLQKTPGRGFAIDQYCQRFYRVKYSGHSSKEQDKTESFVRFSEQPLVITTVYR